MCRGGKRPCFELGAVPATWSQAALLVPPDWFIAQLEPLVQAIRLAAAGDVPAARSVLKEVEESRLRTWYVEHGQVSGNCRVYVLRSPLATAVAKPVGPRDPTETIARDVLERDDYTCQYCAVPLIPKAVFGQFSKVVGATAFRATGNNTERHGAVLAFRANVDHVFPWNLGGTTTADNLVAACWCCNYGKANFTLEQLGLRDPRNSQIRPPTRWSGLTELIPALKAVARRNLQS